MRFPVFSSDHFVLPQHQFYGCGPNAGRRDCSSSTMPTRSSLPSWPSGASAAAGFIPLVMMGPRCGGEPHQRHAAPSSSQWPPSGCCGNRATTSQPDLAEAFNVARLLGDLFGQPACSSAHAEKKGSSTGKKKPASQCSSPEKCHEKTLRAPYSSSRTSDTAQASNPDASDTAPKSSCYEKRIEQSESSPMTTQKTEDQRLKDEYEGSRPGEMSESQVWCHSLCLFGFAPNKVSVKVKKGAAHVHALTKKTYGSGTHRHKLETTQVVKLPENIDPKTLTCSMNRNGILLLQAAFKDNDVDKDTALEVEKLTNKAERAETMKDDEQKTDTIEDKLQMKGAVENTVVLVDQEEKTLSSQSEEERMVNIPEAHASENTTDNWKTPENKAENKEALEYKPERVYTLQTSAGDFQAAEAVIGEADAEDKAARCTDEEPTTEEPDMQDHCFSEEAQETDTEQVKNQQAALHMKEDTKNQTTTDTDYDSSFPIIEEPENDSSDEEDLLQHHTNTQQSSTEDFIVIADDFINTEAIELDTEDENNDGINKDEIHTDGEATSKDQVQADDAAEEQSDEQIGTLDDTDPTRPIKRTNSQELAQDSNTNIGIPGEQSGTISSTQATDQGHRGAFRASLPLVGFSPEDVHVNLQGHVLHIVAKRQAWLGEASYTESVERELKLPEHLDVQTLRCMYQQGEGCLVITAEPHCLERQVPVVLQ